MHGKGDAPQHVDQDEIIGVTEIDLSSLLSSESTISGHHNIVDADGQINGQMKVIANT